MGACNQGSSRVDRETFQGLSVYPIPTSLPGLCMQEQAPNRAGACYARPLTNHTTARTPANITAVSQGYGYLSTQHDQLSMQQLLLMVQQLGAASLPVRILWLRRPVPRHELVHHCHRVQARKRPAVCLQHLPHAERKGVDVCAVGQPAGDAWVGQLRVMVMMGDGAQPDTFWTVCDRSSSTRQCNDC